MSKFLELGCGCTGTWGKDGKGITRPCALHWKPGDNPDLEPTPAQKEIAEKWAEQMKQNYYGR